MYKKPQGILNEFTGRHLDFYYKDVLRLTKKAAVADKAHLLLELKKQSSAITISPKESLFGGQRQHGRCVNLHTDRRDGHQHLSGGLVALNLFGR